MILNSFFFLSTHSCGDSHGMHVAILRCMQPVFPWHYRNNFIFIEDIDRSQCCTCGVSTPRGLTCNEGIVVRINRLLRDYFTMSRLDASTPVENYYHSIQKKAPYHTEESKIMLRGQQDPHRSRSGIVPYDHAELKGSRPNT